MTADDVPLVDDAPVLASHEDVPQVTQLADGAHGIQQPDCRENI